MSYGIRVVCKNHIPFLDEQNATMGNITRVYRLGDLEPGELCSIRFKSGTIVSGRYNGQGKEIGSFLIDDNVFYCEFVQAIFAGA